MKDHPYSFEFYFDQETYDILGPYRVEMIHKVTEAAVRDQAMASYWVAIHGALRYPTSLRPEVLINARGRLL